MSRFKFALLGLLVWLTPAVTAEQRRLFILHTNDIHGFIEQYEEGGLERIAALVRQYRQEHPGAVVLLDAGDTSLGTPLSGAFHGKPTAQLMDLMDYDAIALGNHEFNWGKQKMRSLTETMDTPVLCANLVAEDASPPPYPAYTVVERNGVKLGVFGLVTPDTPRRAPVESTRDWEFLETVPAARAALAAMPREVDVVVSLNHIGVERDKELAATVPEIDLIVGGHSHTALHDAIFQSDTPIVQAGCYGKYLGVVEIEVDTDLNTLKVLSSKLLPARDVEPDPAAHRIVEKFATELRPLMNRQIAVVVDRLDKHAPDYCYDTPLGNFISDVFREQAETDIALYNRGGVRFSMESGPLTVARIFELFPFDDPVTVLEATGAQLAAIVEQGTIDGQGPLSASGLEAVIRDGELLELRVEGAPVDPDALYTIATTRFLSGGGDGMAALAGLKRIRTLPFTRDVLLTHLEGVDEIRSPGCGRLRIEGE